MDAASLVFFVSHVRVEVRSPLREVIDLLSSVWAGCARPLEPTSRVARFSAEPSAGGFVVSRDGGESRTTTQREDVLPVLEASIYRAIPSWHEHQVLLHAACVQRDGATLLLLGRSGAGKSSLALAAVRRGFEYFSDELSVTDGARIWGVPRAIQFEPIERGGKPPPWARDADLTRYPLRLADGRQGVVPLWLPPSAQVSIVPAAVGELHLCAIERGPDTRLERCTSIEALAALHEAAFQPPSLDLGPLVRSGRCARLTWRDPESAIELLGADMLATTTRT